MSRYIDADAIEKEGWYMQRIRQEDSKTMVLETKKPSEFPTADVRENVRGNWLWGLAENGWANHVCSNCGWTKNTDVHVMLGYDYCPNCGADMRKPMTIPKEIIDSVLGYDD